MEENNCSGYEKYPKFVEAVRSRSDRYNRSLETLKDLEREGNVFVLRPGDEICLANNEADADKLREYYLHGYKTAEDKKEIKKNFVKYLTSSGINRILYKT